MSIVSSVNIVVRDAPSTVSRWVIERHTDSTGRVHTMGPYLAAPNFDIAAALAAHADQLAQQLADDEAAQEMGV